MSPALPQPAALLQARGLVARRGGRPVLHGVDLVVPPGCWLAVVGPNGAGKSTLLAALAGLLPAEGDLRWQGRPLAQWSARERARFRAWLGQTESGGEDLRVEDVVMLGRLPHQRWLAAPSAADRTAVHEAMRATQCLDWLGRPLGQLSGGERQRVLLARALAVQAPLLLMDEPVANLDPPHQSDWLAMVRAQTAAGRTVISVLHELTLALQADRLLVLDAGRAVLDGGSGNAATHAALEAVFGHRIAVRRIDGLWAALPMVPPASASSTATVAAS